MKLTAEPGALAAAVKFAAQALPARPFSPVLAGLRITAAGDGSVEVAGFDYQTSARSRAGAEVGEPGTVLVPGRLLADITARLPKAPAGLAAADDALTVTCGSTRYRLHLLPIDEYPALPDLPAAAGYADAGEFTAAVAQVAVAAGRDATLPVLTGVHLAFTPDAIELTATDRYRAAFGRLPWQVTASGPLPPPVLIPATALSAAARAADSGPVRIHIATAPDGVPVVAGLGCGGQLLATLLLSGDYPAMAGKIPQGFSATVAISAAELAEAVRRLAIVAPRDMPVSLAFTPGQLELTAGSNSDADGREVIGCDLDGDPVTIGFHPRRLLDAVTATATPRARIAITTPTKAALITPAPNGENDSDGQDQDQDQDQARPGYRHVLMPIRLTG